MKYMGSKAKIKKYIIPIIQQRMNDFNINTYIEPFVGGANVIDDVVAPRKIASDIERELIALYKNLDKVIGLPDEMTHEHYSDVMASFRAKDSRYEDWYKGAIGFLASYNGRGFDGGFSGVRTIASGAQRNYYLEAKRNLLQQAEKLKGVEWQCGDYEDLYSDVSDCLIYCDIPYRGTKGYGKKFDYDRFWNWADRMSDYNVVLVSEQTAPFPFESVWEMPIKRTIDNASTVCVTEKLFERAGD